MSEPFCTRVACGEHASASLLINARDLEAQLVDIQEGSSLGGVPLCRGHADAVVVPLGWTQADSRSPEPEPESEPELTLIGDTEPDSMAETSVLRLPIDEDEAEAKLEGNALGEVPPLLSRAFRVAGLD